MIEVKAALDISTYPGRRANRDRTCLPRLRAGLGHRADAAF